MTSPTAMSARRSRWRALANPWLHLAQHACFFGTGLGRVRLSARRALPRLAMAKALACLTVLLWLAGCGQHLPEHDPVTGGNAKKGKARIAHYGCGSRHRRAMDPRPALDRPEDRDAQGRCRRSRRPGYCGVSLQPVAGALLARRHIATDMPNEQPQPQPPAQTLPPPQPQPIIDWAQQLHVTPQDLRSALEEVGPLVLD